MAPATRATRSTGCATRSTWSSWSARKTDLRRVGLALDRAVPVPRRAHAVVLRQRRGEALPLLRLPGEGRRDSLRRGDRGARLPRGGRAAGRALRRRARARERGSAGRAAPRAGASGCCTLLERTAGYYASYLWELAGGRARRASTSPGAGCGRRCCASSASATRRAPGTGCSSAPSATGSRREELAAAGLAQRAQRGGLYDRFRGRIMFPLATRAAACSASARGRWARGAARST